MEKKLLSFEQRALLKKRADKLASAFGFLGDTGAVAIRNAFDPAGDGLPNPTRPELNWENFFLEGVFYPLLPYNLIGQLAPNTKIAQEMLMVQRPVLSMQPAGASCATRNDAQNATLSRKVIDPALFEFTIRQCTKDVLYTSLAEMYNAGGNFAKIYENPVFVRAINELYFAHAIEEINRLYFLADSYNPAILTPAATGGWANPTEDYFYNATRKNITGLFPQIVADAAIPRVTISQNSGANEAAQFAMTSANAMDYMNSVYMNASMELRADSEKYFLVTENIFLKLIEEKASPSITATGYITERTSQIRRMDGALQEFKQYYFRDIPIYVDYATSFNVFKFFRVAAGLAFQQYLPNRIIFGTRRNTVFAMDVQRLEQAFASDFDYDAANRVVLKDVATMLDVQYAFSHLWSVAY